jgi:iron transport multicopper oxidase
MNGITYVPQKVPTLYTVLSTGASATNPVVYGQVNPFIISSNQVVQIVLNNADAALHPFHLHGHNFQVIARPASGSGAYPGGGTFPVKPMRRDTVVVNGNSYVVLRFQATNPGVWLFHCHIEWHVELGLTATIIEAPNVLQSTLFIPQQHLDACTAGGYPTQGNAAGNTANFTDLTGANTAMPNPDYG